MWHLVKNNCPPRFNQMFSIALDFAFVKNFIQMDTFLIRIKSKLQF